MANNQILKDAISNVIKTNGTNSISGQLLQDALISIINQFGLNRQFAGIAIPATVPNTVDTNVFYIASTPGVYANFNGIQIKKGELYIFYNTPAWVSINVFSVLLDEIRLKSDSDFTIYPTIADANLAIKNEIVEGKNLRDGRIVLIGSDYNYALHWWKGAFADINLVPLFADLIKDISLNTSLLNEWSIEGKNKANKALFVGKRYMADGRILYSGTYCSTPLYSVTPGQTWSMSGHRNNSSSFDRVIFYNAAGAVLGTIIKGNGTTSTTFVIPATAEKMGINISDSLDVGTVTNNIYANAFQLELSATVTAYEPYTRGINAAKIVGSLPYVSSAIFDPLKAKIDSWTIKGKQLIDKTTITSGYYQTSGNPAASTTWGKVFVKVLPNTKYSLSGVINTSHMGNEYSASPANTANYVRAIPGDNPNVRTFTTSETTQWLGINVFNGSHSEANDTVMLNVGDPSSYEPFGKEYINRGSLSPEDEPDPIFEPKLYVEKTLNNFDIYTFQYDNVYLRQRYSRYSKDYVPDVVSFYDIWKLGELKKVIKSGTSFNPVEETIVPHPTEWETAINIEGSHVSGQQHGFERKLQNIFKVDGIIIPETFVGNFECDKLEFAQISQLYKFNTTINPVINKWCAWEITKDHIRFVPRIQSIVPVYILGRAYMGMMAINIDDIVGSTTYPITTTAYNNVSYYLNDLHNIIADGKLTIGEGNNNPDTSKLWKQGAEFGCSFELLKSKTSFANHKLFLNAGGKTYNVVTSDYTMAIGEIFEVEIEIKYNLKKPA